MVFFFDCRMHGSMLPKFSLALPLLRSSCFDCRIGWGPSAWSIVLWIEEWLFYNKNLKRNGKNSNFGEFVISNLFNLCEFLIKFIESYKMKLMNLIRQMKPQPAKKTTQSYGSVSIRWYLWLLRFGNFTFSLAVKNHSS